MAFIPLAKVVNDLAEKVAIQLKGNCDFCPFWDFCNPCKDTCEDSITRFFEQYTQ